MRSSSRPSDFAHLTSKSTPLAALAAASFDVLTWASRLIIGGRSRGDTAEVIPVLGRPCCCIAHRRNGATTQRLHSAAVIYICNRPSNSRPQQMLQAENPQSPDASTKWFASNFSNPYLRNYLERT